MRITDQYFWNFVFTVFFLILVIMGVIILDSEARIPFDELTLIDFTLVTLASWRLIRLFQHDSFMKFFREQFWDAKKVGKGFVLEKPKAGPRRTIADLLSCSWILGLFFASTVSFFYLLTTWAVYPVVFLAVAAVASFMQIIATVLGQRVE